jgi:hypothetical protein
MMEKDLQKPPFIPGMELAEGFYKDAVKPVFEAAFPGLAYSAALIGSGSEVLGFDTQTSTDHHWGPRVMLFLAPGDFTKYKEKIRDVMGRKLPREYRGYSTNFSEPDPNDNGVQLLRARSSGPINHRVETFTNGGFFTEYLGVDIDKKLDALDWLTLPQQKLRSIVYGRVFHDALGLEKIKQRFSWYPPDVWLYILAGLWQRIGQEEHLTGRAGQAGDEAGSAVIASRLVRDIMRLAFIMEKQYPPYAKWLGTAFSSLKSAPGLKPVLEGVIHGKSWQKRDKYLAEAYAIIAEMHNALGVTTPLPTTPQLFHQRPFHIIDGARFTAALLDKIDAPWLTPAMRRSPLGSIDIFTDNSDMLEDPVFRLTIRKLYE